MDEFAGPLFVVGSPRSGTKLLRDLLNQNGEVSLCNPETHFIPYLYRKYRREGAGFDADIDAFYADFDATPFQIFSRRMGHRTMTRRDFDQIRDAGDWAEAFEVILRSYSAPTPGGATIWGDKTPSYVLEMPLLKEIFPRSRFVHIIRDPRDVALSARRAWGHSLSRVASKWLRDMAAAQRDRGGLGSDYMEVLYERLLTEPAAELQRICGFLGCSFDARMTTLPVPSENIGNARGKRFVDGGNLAGWRQGLTRREQQRVEEIVFPALADLPYDPVCARSHVPLRRIEALGLQLIDGASSSVRHVRKKGLVDGIRISCGNRLQKRRNFLRRPGGS